MDPLRSDRPVIVYLDFKSPYAYLAKEPTAEMARALGIEVDWRPFVLDIPSYLGSARLGRKGEVVEQNRSAEQWSGIKYAYFDCRRYADLRGVTVRGTVKIWDTNLAAVAMLWAKRQGDEVLKSYMDCVYDLFWKRALDVEDIDVMRGVLAGVGADVEGFADYARGRGAEENQALQEAAFDAGIFGVPSYILKGEVYFGREHLPHIGWRLAGEQGASPDISYSAAKTPKTPKTVKTESLESLEVLDVCIDFKSPHSYLAIAPTLKLAAELGLKIDWHPTATAPLKPPSLYVDADRGGRHRRFRAEAIAHDLRLYAPHALQDIYANFDTRPASMGLLWLKRKAPTQVDLYVELVFQLYWRDRKPIDGVEAIEAIMRDLGVEAGAFVDYATTDGLAALEVEEQKYNIIVTPTYFLDDEPFIGRQHLPMIKARRPLGSRGDYPSTLSLPS